MVLGFRVLGYEVSCIVNTEVLTTSPKKYFRRKARTCMYIYIY